MSYESQESSAQAGAPIELFRISGAENFYYTSSSAPYDYNGRIYQPVPIKRTAPTINSKESSASMSLKFPFNNPFVSRYLGGVPPEPDTLTIFRVHLSDTTDEVKRFWYGTVSSVKFSGDTATVSILGVMARLGQQIPVSTYSWMCNHALYDGKCGVSQAANVYTFTVASISSDGVTVNLTDFGQAAAKLSDSTYFNGGIFTAPGDIGQRTVLKFEQPDPISNTYQAVLLVPAPSLSVGDQITVTAGCDHSIQTCHSRFNNASQYGGFPYIPTLNPFSTDKKR